MPESDFYVGYEPAAPAGLAGFLRARVALLVILALVLAAALTAAQRPFSKAVFEFGSETELVGVIELEPYPTLRVARPGTDAGESRYLLVAFGKFGADEAVAAFAGREVRLRGTLIYRDDQVMVELAEDSIEDLGPAPGTASAMVSLGVGIYAGEIVDSKCYLGVMKPGNTKPHRDCATRCLSGGVPPVLLVRDVTGNARYLLLTDREGGQVGREVVARQLVAEPVLITGEVWRQGDRYLLRADVGDYERIP